MKCVKAVFYQLAILQHPILEDDLVDAIFDGLESSYHPFVIIIEARVQSVSYDDLYDLLLSEETQMKS